MRCAPFLAISLPLLACTTSQATTSAEAGSSGAPASSSDTSTSNPGGSESGAPATSTTAASTTGTEGPGVKLDVGGVADTSGSGTAGEEEGCKKIDVIITIDHSDSMYEEIAALAGPVFDTFPEALLSVNNGLEDFQLGVMDACNNPAILHDTGMAMGFCDFSTGRNFMRSSSPNLLDEYHCVTDLAFNGYMGTPDLCTMNNDDEAPANTAADAVNPPFVDEENDGFLRNDAVLFIVAITDEDEQPVPPQLPQQVVDKIIDAKNGIENVVFLGIGGGSNCIGPYGSAQNALVLKQIAQIFADEGQGLFWDLCAGDLGTAFETVLATVDETCQNFNPPG